MRVPLRRWIHRATAVALSAVVFVGVLEIALRFAPQIVRPGLTNRIFSKYGTGPADIYFVEPTSRMLFMRPNFTTRAFYNGYFWDHMTDAHGFRNPVDRQVPTILSVGDSLIYGHGVDDGDGVISRLHREYGYPVYNMARQGDCLYQQYVLLRLYLDEFRPRRVLLFVFLNDLNDLEIYRSTDEILAAPEITRYDYDAIRHNVALIGANGTGLLQRAWNGSYSHKLFSVMADTLRNSRTEGQAHAADGDVHPFVAPVRDANRLARLGEYYDRVLTDLDTRCRAIGTELVVVYLTVEFLVDEATGDALREAQARFGAVLQSIAGTREITFIATDELLRGCHECFLEHDGHFSALGHQRLASFLDGRLRYLEGIEGSRVRSDGGRRAVAAWRRGGG